MAMGTTDDPNKSGEVRYALDAGLALDSVRAGAGPPFPGHLRRRRVCQPELPRRWDERHHPFSRNDYQTSDSTYNYVMFPVALVGKLAMGRRHSLNLRGGGFAGYFLSGTSDLTYSPEMSSCSLNGEVPLDDTNTELWMYGLSFYAGLDLFTKGRLSITPSLEFNLGLTDTSVDLQCSPPPSKDTFWALTANVGIRYGILK